MADSHKKIRFSSKEKELLVSLLKQEKVIDNKKTNKSTNKLKNEAWDRITKKYNCHAFVTKRGSMQLKRCWEKIKQMRKDARTREVKSRLVTCTPLLPDEYHAPGVDEVVPHLMYEIPNTVDSDTVFKKERKTENNQTECEWDPKTSQPSFTIDSISMPGSPPLECTLSEVENGMERDMTPERSQSVQPTTNNVRPPENVISTRQNNVLKECEHEQDLYLLRRSILLIEKQQALENLRHRKEINRIKEIDEAEKLEHQRELRRIELMNFTKQLNSS